MISWLAKEFFAQSPLLFYPVLALVLFITVFLVQTVRAIRMDADKVERLARLPLDTEKHDG